jgi:hypothetical protein
MPGLEKSVEVVPSQKQCPWRRRHLLGLCRRHWKFLIPSPFPMFPDFPPASGLCLSKNSRFSPQLEIDQKPQKSFKITINDQLLFFVFATLL